MIKMTYTEAATCGMNLKVRVTPEKSEKMQLAWFAAGKTWQGGRSIVTETGMEYLYLDETLSFGHDFIESFNNNEAEEIELIDDTPQPDFASQQDLWRYLSEKDKNNKVINKDKSIIAGFSTCGNLFDYKNHAYFSISGDVVDFSDVIDWEKYTPPRLIRVNSVEVPTPLESFDGIDAY